MVICAVFATGPRSAASTSPVQRTAPGPDRVLDEGSLKGGVVVSVPEDWIGSLQCSRESRRPSAARKGSRADRLHRAPAPGVVNPRGRLSPAANEINTTVTSPLLTRITHRWPSWRTTGAPGVSHPVYRTRNPLGVVRPARGQPSPLRFGVARTSNALDGLGNYDKGHQLPSRYTDQPRES
jgi:hypothetical protein